MWKLSIVLLLSLAILAVAAITMASGVVYSRPRTASTLYGTYTAEYEIAKEKLTLNDDGSFEQEVTLKQTLEVNTTRGRWDYNPETGYIGFRDKFMRVLDGLGRFNPSYADPRPGTVVLPANVWFGRIQVGSGERIIYERVSSDTGS